MRGKFLVLEGIDGAGKSTHVDYIAQCIRELHGVDVVVTREPGGTPLAESIRSLLLHQPMDVQTEVLLVLAARADHVRQKIRPALESGSWVLCDRFVDSTRAYQGGGGGVDLGWIDGLNASVCEAVWPDRIYLFDLPAELAAQRRGGRGGPSDRFEGQDVAYFERVRRVYLEQMRPGAQAATRVIDSRMDVSRIQIKIKEDIVTI